jgi:uncharacterized membrane protein YfcA
MIRASASPEPAARIFIASMVAMVEGIFLGIFLLFVNPEQAVVVALVILAGIVGVLSFFRHTISTSRTSPAWAGRRTAPVPDGGGLRQPLAIGVMAHATAVFSGGMTAAAVCLFTYGLS